MNEDYIDSQTGLLICGTCHTPKEAYFPKELYQIGGTKHAILCQCGIERLEHQEESRRQREHWERVEELRREAFREIPAGGWRFSEAQWTEPLRKASRYAENWEEMQSQGLGLLLFGDVGTGKSYAAGCIANALLDGEHAVKFVSCSNIVNLLQGLYPNERNAFFKKLLQSDLLILDDLGAERSTSYGREQIFEVVNQRTLSEKPMVVTTNVPLEVMKHTKDLQERRIYDRVLKTCIPLQFSGESFRRLAAAENLHKAAAILNQN